MTYEPDIERVLDDWFGAGPSRMPDGFLDRAVGRIDSVPQSRLARLRARDFTFARNRNGRLVTAAMAVVVVAVVGGTVLSRLPAVGVLPSPSPSVTPSASPSAGPSASVQAAFDLTRLQATWSSVGTRQLPYGHDSVTTPTDLVIGSGTVQLGFEGVRNSVALVGSDRLELTSEMGPNPMWKCNLGDLGTYDFSLRVTGGRLTLTPVSDDCPSRAAILTGDWDHTNLGPLAPGRHLATPIRPFGGGTTGSFYYTVPAGWKEEVESPSVFAISGPDPAVLTRISVMSNVIPATEDQNCDGHAVADVGRTPTEVAAWLATQTGLVVTQPTPVTIGRLERIGRLDGVMVDVSVARNWNEPCTSVPQPGTSVTTFVDAASGDQGPVIGGEARARYFLLDRGDGQTLLIDVEAQDTATWSPVMAAAMPVVNNFEFYR